MGWKVSRRQEEPDSRLTRLCHTAIETVKASADYDPSDRIMVFILNENTESGTGGGGIDGYESDDDTTLVTDMVVHLNSMLLATGKQVQFVPMGGSPN